jgi:hypothetical protein
VRRIYLQEFVAPVMLLLAFVMSAIAGVPIALRGPLLEIGRAFSQGLGLVWWWAPIVLTVLHHRGRLAREQSDPTRLRVMVPLVRLMIGFALIALAYSNLKAVLPRVNGLLADGELLQVDTWLGFGRPWNQRLGAIDAPWFVGLMNWAYLSFFFYFPVAMGIALFKADVEMLEEVIQGFGLVFFLGTVLYYLLPSAGTIYTHPEWHASAQHTEVWRVRDALARQQAAIIEGRPVRIRAFFGIGAFPSLHVAHALLALDIVRRRHPRAVWIAAIPFGLMVLSTVYFGWHYVVDLVGAVVVTWAALRAVRWDRQRRQTPALA